MAKKILTQQQNNIVFSVNDTGETFLEFKTNGDVFYNFKGDIKKDVDLLIKYAPVELAFADIINNAMSYSSDGKVDISIKVHKRYTEFRIADRVKDIISEENYMLLGREDIKRADGTYSTGLHEAFQSLKENNDIEVVAYDDYSRKMVFEVIIKLKNK